MGYLFLSISLLCGTAKGFCGKKVSQKISGLKDSMLANLIRMFLCVIISFGVILAGSSLSFIKPSLALILITALSGISTALFVALWLVAASKNAYMLVDVFLMLGLLVPLLGSMFFFDEPITLIQWLGIAILFGAVLLMCSYNTSLNGKMTLSGLALLIACGFSSGLADFSQKLFVHTFPEIPTAIFNFYTYVFAAATLVIVSSLIKKEGSTGHNTLFRKIYGYIIIMAACLFLNSYFKTLAAHYLDSVQLYPLSQGMALILSTLMVTIFFHEKPTVRSILGILLAFAGLIFINVLS